MKRAFSAEDLAQILNSGQGPVFSSVGAGERAQVIVGQPASRLLIPDQAYDILDLCDQGLLSQNRAEMQALADKAAEDLSWHKGEEVKSQVLGPEVLYLGDCRWSLGLGLGGTGDLYIEVGLYQAMWRDS